MNLLLAEDIRKKYGNVEVLRGINIQIKSGELITIVGSSGAGKSTLLHIIGTLDKPDSGSVTLNNIPINQLNSKSLAAFRNKYIGFIFQFHHLLPEFTVSENILMPSMIAKQNNHSAKQWSIELMKFLGISALANRKPTEISGGEAQRVAVARALINKPALICADEPTGNLDSANARALHQLFFELRKLYMLTFIIATHNEELASQSDRILRIKDGLLEQ